MESSDQWSYRKHRWVCLDPAVMWWCPRWRWAEERGPDPGELPGRGRQCRCCGDWWWPGTRCWGVWRGCWQWEDWLWGCQSPSPTPPYPVCWWRRSWRWGRRPGWTGDLCSLPWKVCMSTWSRLPSALVHWTQCRRGRECSSECWNQWASFFYSPRSDDL